MGLREELSKVTENPMLARQGRRWVKNERVAPLIADVAKFIVGETPGEVAFNLALGVPGKAARIGGLGLAALLGSEEAEAGKLGSASARREALERIKKFFESQRRPEYDVKQRGEFKDVSARRGAGGAGGRAGAEGQTGEALAQEYARRSGIGEVSSEASRRVGSSLSKQSSVAAAAEEAQRGGKRYKEAVYEGYGRAVPEIIDLTGAKNYDELLNATYDNLLKETQAQFDVMSGAGIKTRYHGGAGEYPSSGAMIEDVTKNKNLNVFQGGNPHPELSAIDPRTGLNANEQFRAVHDYFGHAVPGTQFGPRGEEGAFVAHSQLYSPMARPAMAAETRGQNSIVNYSPLNAEFHLRRSRGEPVDYQRDFQFAPNRGFLLPPEMIHPDYAGKMPEYVRDVITPQNPVQSGDLFHWSEQELARTDPSKYGTGIAGAEADRLRYGENPQRLRTSFYTDPTLREANLGMKQHQGASERFYNMQDDPENLAILARAWNKMDRGQELNDLERMVWERGYAGYRGGGGHAVAFEPIDVKRIK